MSLPSTNAWVGVMAAKTHAELWSPTADSPMFSSETPPLPSQPRRWLAAGVVLLVIGLISAAIVATGLV